MKDNIFQGYKAQIELLIKEGFKPKARALYQFCKIDITGEQSQSIAQLFRVNKDGRREIDLASLQGTTTTVKKKVVQVQTDRKKKVKTTTKTVVEGKLVLELENGGGDVVEGELILNEFQGVQVLDSTNVEYVELPEPIEDSAEIEETEEETIENVDWQSRLSVRAKKLVEENPNLDYSSLYDKEKISVKDVKAIIEQFV